MARAAAFAALLAIGAYGGMLLKHESPQAKPVNVPQINAAIDHGEAAISPVRWGRYFGGYRGYYGPYYGGYTTYYGPGWGGYYSPYYGGYYGYGYGPYYSWWW
jgi:hypothetical protein